MEAVRGKPVASIERTAAEMRGETKPVPTFLVSSLFAWPDWEGLSTGLEPANFLRSLFSFSSLSPSSEEDVIPQLEKLPICTANYKKRYIYLAWSAVSYSEFVDPSRLQLIAIYKRAVLFGSWFMSLLHAPLKMAIGQTPFGPTNSSKSQKRDDQYDNLSLHTQKGIEFLERYGHFIRDRCAIEMEYASKLRYTSVNILVACTVGLVESEGVIMGVGGVERLHIIGYCSWEWLGLAVVVDRNSFKVVEMEPSTPCPAGEMFHEDAFFKSIVTGDETWVVPSMQWKLIRSASPPGKS
ncbi:hypothetical protein AAG570_011418 [Ranatra chinensis]|uniref:FCH domain-containing protein n=1 Tax=Ranatra chinensis TaxID=642074 RepID=A0ABD0YKJ6_9HEMI